MTYDLTITQACWLIALLFGSFGLDFLLRPRSAQAGLAAFPRHRIAGVVLATFALLWAAWLLNTMQLGFLDAYKPTLFFLTPIAIYLVITYLDDLLGPRALGGLMMMLPTALLDASRWHDSSLRYLPIVIAYLFVIFGIWLTLCPFRFRIWARPLVDSEAITRLTGAILTALAILFVAAALAL
ncbi:MAG TPA: hypothetical protein PKE55_13815 [Kiritimatiellia bacterium]|nr:hypothetical protein [Kiritimatiellia bacterium]